jgi:hypothetical protein
MRERDYDPACEDLAEHFLSEERITPDTETEHVQRVRSLSQALQTAAEDWLEDNPQKGDR